jgi:hypothetical protein
MGAVYTSGAFTAGRLTRACRRWLSPRALLGALLGVQAVLCIGPVVFDGPWALWAAAAGASLASSIQWPLIESYVTAGRHGPEMRSAIGWFNLVWMTAVTLPLLLMPPILEHHAEWAIGAQALSNVLSVAVLAWFAPQPGHHDPLLAHAHVPMEYGLLLRCARALLPMSYVLNAALSPILPYRFHEIGADVQAETPATATWMLVRVVVMAAMWRAGFWHGRWGTLLLAGLSMTGGFAVVVLAPSLPLMLAGFAVFGLGMGISYYAALYYAMSVGRAEIDAGGTHEGLIGLGYTIGPAAGLAGTALGGGPAIVAIVWGLVALGSLSAGQSYLRARRLRRRAA